MVDTSGLSDALQQTQIARLQAGRNPNLSTDQGINSVSPYFLGATANKSATTISQLSSQWSQTASNIAAIDQDTKAQQDQAAALKAAQRAADNAAKLQQQIQTGALRADAANQKKLAALQKAAGQYATGSSYTFTNTPGSGMKGNNGLGVDAQSRAMYQHAINNGYAGRVTQASYSKSYTYDPTISAARNKALSLASSYLGTNYVLGGESHRGIDCSGLVQVVYQQLGFKVPTHSAADQGQTGGRAGNGRGIPGTKTSVSNLKPGDLVAWNDGSHIAVYAGNGYIIEAANTRVGTVKRKLWSSAVVGIHLNI